MKVALLVLGAVGALGAALTESDLGRFVNTEITQNVDLTVPYVKRSVEVSTRNDDDVPNDKWYVPIPASEADYLAIFEAQSGSGDMLPVSLEGELDYPNESYAVYRIQLPEPLEPGESTEFTYTQAIVRTLRPLPFKAQQSGTQYMFYNSTRTVPSFYNTENQKTLVKIVTQNVNDLTTGQSGPQSGESGLGGVLTYGPFKDTQPLHVQRLELQYENPLMQPHVALLNRTVWVSHWGGSVSFDESYDVLNDGTRLAKPFSRLDFQRFHAGFSLNTAAIRHLALRVPALTAREHYYVDLVGNVSTSAVGAGILDVVPRYPVMGGWLYNFTVGWAADIGEFVRSPSADTFVLAVPLVAGPDDVSYDKVVNRIVLPEGATEIQAFDPFAESVDMGVTYSYLDLYGRPTIELRYRDLVSDHAATNLYVTYKYSTAAALRKPLSYAAAVLAGALGLAYVVS